MWNCVNVSPQLSASAFNTLPSEQQQQVTRAIDLLNGEGWKNSQIVVKDESEASVSASSFWITFVFSSVMHPKSTPLSSLTSHRS
jgi:hypothetical protein